jgi:hypothetical protein
MMAENGDWLYIELSARKRSLFIESAWSCGGVQSGGGVEEIDGGAEP